MHRRTVHTPAVASWGQRPASAVFRRSTSVGSRRTGRGFSSMAPLSDGTGCDVRGGSPKIDGDITSLIDSDFPVAQSPTIKFDDSGATVKVFRCEDDSRASLAARDRVEMDAPPRENL